MKFKTGDKVLVKKIVELASESCPICSTLWIKQMDKFHGKEATISRSFIGCSTEKYYLEEDDSTWAFCIHWLFTNKITNWKKEVTK